MNAVYGKKGEDYSFFSWYHTSNEFVNYRMQPNPADVVNGMNSFVAEYYGQTLHQDAYTIVIGISHSWVIDAYLLYKIPAIEAQVKKVIQTAGFFKVECGEMNYLGKWVSL